jgi:CelD/BcsL family acetyltransferase involved in cellulose biosynthesis
MFGDEAINTIVQEMENSREDMIVIFAGYPDKMEEFLRKNPGLRSRVAFHVPFADYTAGELCDITALLADKKQLSLDAAVRGKLLPIFESARREGDFGNGRYARNLFEKALMKQASRLVSRDADDVSKADIELLLADDFEAPPITKADARRRIGFAP